MENKDIRLLKQMENSAVSMPEMSKKSEYTKQQIHYRLTEKWNDLVIKDSERENAGSIPSTTLWRLSTKGQKKLESVEITDGDETEIETFEELSEIASEASRDAESAKSSVQKYRKKLSRVDGRVTSIKEATEEPWSELEGDSVTILTDNDKDELTANQDRLERDIGNVEADITNVRENINDIQTTASEQSKHISILDRKVAELVEEKNELNQKVEKQSERIDELEGRISELEEDENSTDESKSVVEQLADLF
jgi:chromosome segregation ATPase